jgi:glycerophosphoryl diester phosphodiesterase
MAASPLPEIIAHRGASRDRYENTLDAFAQALLQQADGIELDVHATADGAVVVHHDPILRIRCKPADLTPPRIAQATLAELQRLRLADGSRLPTLDDVCALVGSRAYLYVEIKSPGLEEAVPAVLARHPTVRAAVHSFDHRVPASIARAHPSIATGVLLSSYLVDPVAPVRAVGARDLWMGEALIDEALVAQLHGAGCRVIAWTVDDTTRAGALARLGIDGLCTNRPALLRAALAAHAD